MIKSKEDCITFAYSRSQPLLTFRVVGIDDVGLARYDLIRPVLVKIENPEHLVSSPALIDL